MKITIYDIRGNRYDIICTNWNHEQERYVFFNDSEIVAVFHIDGIVGFVICE